MLPTTALNPNYLIYVLCEPEDRVGSTGRFHKKGEIRYVGLSTRGTKRPGEHFYSKNLKQERIKDWHTYRWIAKLKRSGTQPVIKVLCEGIFNDYKHLCQVEKFYIAYFRGVGLVLTNDTDGGEGTPGYKHRPESKAKMSEKAKNRPAGHYLNKKSHPPESRVRAGLKHRGHKRNVGMRRNEDSKRKTAESLRAAWAEDPTRWAPAAVARKAQAAELRRLKALEPKQHKVPRNSPLWRGVTDDRGTIYKTIEDAATACDCHRDTITRSIKLGYPVKGRKFRYLDAK